MLGNSIQVAVTSRESGQMGNVGDTTWRVPVRTQMMLALKIVSLAVFAVAAAGCNTTTTPVSTASGPAAVKFLSSSVSSKGRRHNHAVIADPTGSAPTARVERFELRDGDCVRSDCVPRMLNGSPVTRARSEKHIVTDLQYGDDGRYSYSVYFPSSEYTRIPDFGSTFGQLFVLPGRDASGGQPIWSFDTTEGSNRVEFVAQNADFREGTNAGKGKRSYFVGTLGDSLPFDQWLRVDLRFRLASAPEGYIEMFVDGRRIGRFEGRTMYPGNYLEVDYGIYQTGTNQYRGPGPVPTQTVYFAAVEVVRLP